MVSDLVVIDFAGAGNGARDGQGDSIGWMGFWAIIER